MEQLYGEGTAGSMVVFTQRRQGYGEGADKRWPESPGSSLGLILTCLHLCA